MANLTTFVFQKDVQIYHAEAISSGHGRKTIEVELSHNGKYKKFEASTTDMSAYDVANSLEGDEKHKALYEIIEFDIIDEVADWLENL